MAEQELRRGLGGLRVGVVVEGAGLQAPAGQAEATGHPLGVVGEGAAPGSATARQEIAAQMQDRGWGGCRGGCGVLCCV